MLDVYVCILKRRVLGVAIGLVENLLNHSKISLKILVGLLKDKR